MNQKEWFKEAGFGLMVHWGLYSVIGGEWKSKRIPYIGEWAQSYFRIPNEEYHKLASVFNPIFYNPEEWVLMAKNAGMKYVVFTSKHHEGFSMYHSKVDTFNIVDATPFKRDVVEELANACSKHNMKLGLYYSQDLDWAHPDGGGYLLGRTNGGEMSWTNDWDYCDTSKKDYSRCFENKILPQVEELMTNYGDLLLVWFDTPKTISESQSKQLFDLVKHYQPNCLVNSRIGNGMGDYSSLEDNEIPEKYTETGLVETPTTLNDTWGYKSFDNNWKSADKVWEIKNHLRKCGINYLLNIGPDALGRFPAPACDILKELSERNK